MWPKPFKSLYFVLVIVLGSLLLSGLVLGEEPPILWTADFEYGDYPATPTDIATHKDTVYVVGWHTMSAGGTYMFIKAYDAKNGNVRWQSGHTDFSVGIAMDGMGANAPSIILSPSGEQIFVRFQKLFVNDPPNPNLIRCYDKNGDLLWEDDSFAFNSFDGGWGTKENKMLSMTPNCMFVITGSYRNFQSAIPGKIRAYKIK